WGCICADHAGRRSGILSGGARGEGRRGQLRASSPPPPRSVANSPPRVQVSDCVQVTPSPAGGIAPPPPAPPPLSHVPAPPAPCPGDSPGVGKGRRPEPREDRPRTESCENLRNLCEAVFVTFVAATDQVRSWPPPRSARAGCRAFLLLSACLRPPDRTSTER